MNSERAQEIDEIFQAALDLPSEQRLAYLDRACASDEDLRDEVESLISSYEQAGSFIEQPAIEVDASVVAGPLTSAMAGEYIGHYQIIEPLGSGGMSEVYLASDTRMDRKVALKLLPQYFTQDHERVRRFQQEARAALALNHPNIVTIYEIGQADGKHFIATEFIEGGTLRQRMAHGPLKLDESIDIATQVAGGLTAAHEAGIIHRDIKPENVMLRRDGYAKVLDFGLAKLTEGQVATTDAEAPTRMNVKTDPGIVMGTANYMSPEQARGVKIDNRTDIWSLGVVLYEMVAGRVPFEGETPSDVVSLILQKEAPPLVRYAPETPAELQRIVDKSLTKNRDERYQTVKDLLIDLRRLNKRLEFEDELQRSTSADLRSGGTIATGGGQISATTATLTGPGGAAPTTSSAEYLVGEIKRHKRGAVIILGAIVAALATGAYFYYARGDRTAIDSIAVLPFTNTSADQNLEYLSDGITESLIYSLSQLPNLRVMASSTVFHYKGRDMDARTAAKDLGVRAVLTGKVTQRGDTFSISAELVDAQDNRLLWGEQYNRKLSDILAVQEDISKEISQKLRLRLSGADRQRMTKRYTDNTEAYQLYLKGRYLWNKRNTEALKKGIEYFQQAIAIDPNYALAYSGIADSYFNLGVISPTPPSETRRKGKEAALKALELDDTLAEAHVSLAAIKEWYEWNFNGAEREYRRAFELNPDYPSAHQRYGIFLEHFGRFDEAIAELKRAQKLDPLSLIINSDLGFAYYTARRYEQAIAQLQETIKLDPTFNRAHIYLAWTYAAKGSFEEALKEALKYREFSGNPLGNGQIGYFYAVMGNQAEARKILGEMQENAKQRFAPPALFVFIYIGLGDKDQAFAWLEKAYAERGPYMVNLKTDPRLDSLRSDPRYADLLKRVGFPP